MSSRQPSTPTEEPLLTPVLPSRSSSRSGLSRTQSRTNITFDLQGPHSVNRIQILGSEPATPERTYQRKFTPSPTQIQSTNLNALNRYLPYDWRNEHYKLDPVLQQRYSLDLPMAQRISRLQMDLKNPFNEERRNARSIGRMIYQRPTPPSEHMYYLNEWNEEQVPREMAILDHLTRFEPKHIVLINGKGYPTQSHNEDRFYWELQNLLRNRRQSASEHAKARGPAVPEWPQLTHSFDSKQFIVAAVLFRDDVTRFLAYYLKAQDEEEEARRGQVNLQSINFDGFSLSRVLREGEPLHRKNSWDNGKPTQFSRPQSVASIATDIGHQPHNQSRMEPLGYQLESPPPTKHTEVSPPDSYVSHSTRSVSTHATRRSDPDQTARIIRVGDIPSRSYSESSDSIILSPPHSDRSAPPAGPTPPPLSSIPPDKPLFFQGQSNDQTRLFPGGYPHSPQRFSVPTTVVPDHSKFQQVLSDEPSNEQDEEPLILKSIGQTTSQEPGTTFRAAQTHEEARDAYKELMSPTRAPVPGPSNTSKGKQPIRLLPNSSDEELPVIKTINPPTSILHNTPQTSPAPVCRSIPQPLLAESTRQPFPVDEEPFTPHPGQIVTEILEVDKINKELLEQYAPPPTKHSVRIQPPEGHDRVPWSSRTSRTWDPQDDRSPTSPPIVIGPSVATIEEVEEEEDQAGSGTEHEDGYISVSSFATKVEEIRDINAELRKARRKRDRETRQAQRAVDEEARVARQLERERLLNATMSQAAQIPLAEPIPTVNIQRGRYSSGFNPVMQSFLHPDTTTPAAQSTPAAATHRSRPSMAVPRHFTRAPGSGIAELLGTSGRGGIPPVPPMSTPPLIIPSPPPGPKKSSGKKPEQTSHTSRETPPHQQPSTSGRTQPPEPPRTPTPNHRPASRTPSRHSQAAGGIGGRKSPPPPPPGGNDDEPEGSGSDTEVENQSQRSRNDSRRGRAPRRDPSPNPSNAINDRQPRQWDGPLPLHIEPKLKMDQLPEFTGEDDDIIIWLSKINNLAEQNEVIRVQLGTMLPQRFTKRAFMWWYGIPKATRDMATINWDTLRAAISAHFMPVTWLTKQRTNAARMRFRDAGNSDEQPVDFCLRKKLHLTLINPMAFDQLIHEIMISAPAGWQTILRIDDLQGEWTEFINRVHQHSQALIDAKQGSSKFFKKDKKGKFKSVSRAGKIGDRKDLPRPNFSPAPRNNPKVKKPPSAVNARPCIHCSGDHWDYECPKARKNQPFVRANLASTDPEGLSAQEEYDELYEELSSASSDESSETDEDTEEEESGSEDNEQDFHEPSDVQSATASSEPPFAESEELQDVSEGSTLGQVNAGLATVKCNFNQPRSESSDYPKNLPSRKSLTKQYKLQQTRAYKTLGYTPIGRRLVMRRVMSRPPGTAWMGTTSSVVLGRLGEMCPEFEITFDSGSDITLISQKKWQSLQPLPTKRKGRNIKVIQVTGNCLINEYVTVPIIFETQEGPVEMLVEAYVVKSMSTAFILGNDFSNQYLLSLLRTPEGNYIELGTTGRRVPVIRQDTDPRTDDAGHVFRVESSRVAVEEENWYKRTTKRKKYKTLKALKAAPEGTTPVRVYDTKTLLPNTLNLIRVKADFEPGEEIGYVERCMSSNRTDEDLYGITDCLIHANNPKLQIANFGTIPVKLQAGQIIGYMRPISTLAKEGELSVPQRKQFEATVNFIKSREKLQPPAEEEWDQSYAIPPEGGPKLWDNPGIDKVKKEQLLEEVKFGPNLTPEQKEQMSKVIKKHFWAFGLDGRLGTIPEEVVIKLKDENVTPISQAPYNLSPVKREVVGKQVDEWLHQGVIEPSESPWASPVIVVYRKDKPDKPRVCIDYRKVNEHIVKDQYPLPLQSDIIDALSGSCFLTTLDALAGFNQLTIREQDRLITAFICHRGLFQNAKLPFGLNIGPAKFQRKMKEILAKFQWQFSLVYIDDIVIYSKTFLDHLSHVDQVLEAIEKSGMTLSPKKCNFGFESLELLGRLVSRLGMGSQKEKIDAITGMAEPKNLKQLMTFNGAVIYYSMMIPRMAEIMKPLFDLTAKNVPFVWGPGQKEAFRLIKEALTSAPIMAYPIPEDPYRLYTDASEIGLSGCLQQIQLMKIKDLDKTRAFERLEKAYKSKSPIPKLCTAVPKDEHVVARGDIEWNSENWLETIVPVERVIGYWSRILRSAERNYSATEREALGLKEALVKWQALLEGAEFTAFTDHGALTYAQRFAVTTTRLAKMALFFTSYPGMAIMHRAGRVHNNADALSRYLYRIPYSDNPPQKHKYEPIKLGEDDGHIFKGYKKELAKDIDHLVSNYVMSHLEDFPPTVEVFRVDLELDNAFNQEYDTATSYNLITSIAKSEIDRIKDAYISDPHFKKVLPWVSEKSPINKSHFPQYVLKENGLIYYIGGKEGPRLCIPKSIVPEIIQEAHELASEGAHAGYARTYNRLCATYYWPNMADTVEKFTATCDVCQKTKPRRHGKIGYLQPIPIPEQPFEVVSLDFIMDLPESNGYNAVLVLVDKLTRYAHFIPCTTRINEIETAELFRDHIWAQYGLPRQIISDRDSRWTGAFWDHLTSILGIKRSLTTAHHPQADGQTEVMNQNLEIMLRSYIDDTKSNWSNLLPVLAFSYNTSAHSITRQTPAFLLRGFEPLRPSHLLANNSQHIPRIESSAAEEFSEEMLAARNKAKDAIRIGQVYQERSYNKGRYFTEYNPGDQVLINLKTLNLLRGKGTKLDQIYDGPFEVMEKISQLHTDFVCRRVIQCIRLLTSHILKNIRQLKILAQEPQSHQSEN
ncbi:Retrovirus-related Pol polyprotein from transposon [Ceratobasidium sp. AG-Ba]|nr:Retrovirus-related Pol polyprotein from transposon [Ceratobasidium sp. AG-Ba]